MKTCIIIEDQPPAQRIIQKFISDVGNLELKNTFSDGLEAISFLQNNTVDLIFLDIHLPKISGMDFLKTLKNSPQIILTTAFSEYALKSYEYNVVDYLLKPFSFQRFVQAVAKSNSIAQKEEITIPPEKNTSKDTFFIKSGYDLIKVDQKAIIYIKSGADYCEIVTTAKVHLSSDSLKNWLGKLDSSFYQVHKSYLFNTKHLLKISKNQIYLNNDHIIPIGRAYKEDFVTNYLK